MKKQKKRTLNWDDVKRIVEFKTFYLMIILTLIGTVFLFLEPWFFPAQSTSPFKGIFSSLGITFVTSSTISFIIEIFMRIDIVDFMVSRMLKILPTELKKAAGVTEFNGNRANINFDEIWSKSEGFIKIIGLSANDILSPSRMPLLVKKIKSNPVFPIQILLINPWSTMSMRRAESTVYGTKYECITRVYSIIVELKDVWENLKKANVDVSKIDVKIYDDIPSLSMIINENCAIVTPFTIASQGGSSPYFIAKNIETDDCVYNLYSEHFDLIWQRAVSILDMNYDDFYAYTIANDHEKSNALPSEFDEWLSKIYSHR